MSTEAAQYGYDEEEWETFPDETKDDIRSGKYSGDEVEPDCCLPR